MPIVSQHHDALSVPRSARTCQWLFPRHSRQFPVAHRVTGRQYLGSRVTHGPSAPLFVWPGSTLVGHRLTAVSDPRDQRPSQQAPGLGPSESQRARGLYPFSLTKILYPFSLTKNATFFSKTSPLISKHGHFFYINLLHSTVFCCSREHSAAAARTHSRSGISARMGVHSRYCFLSVLGGRSYSGLACTRK